MPRFLDREVEAQLKPHKSICWVSERHKFPRPRGRGPIEARHSPSTPTGPNPSFLDREVEAQLKLDRLPRRVQLDRGFPRPRGRGPIEAPRVTCSRSARAWFPRPRGRGPIEAGRWMERPGAPQPRFLDREVEAQLKP